MRKKNRHIPEKLGRLLHAGSRTQPQATTRQGVESGNGRTGTHLHTKGGVPQPTNDPHKLQLFIYPTALVHRRVPRPARGVPRTDGAAPACPLTSPALATTGLPAPTRHAACPPRSPAPTDGQAARRFPLRTTVSAPPGTPPPPRRGQLAHREERRRKRPRPPASTHGGNSLETAP